MDFCVPYSDLLHSRRSCHYTSCSKMLVVFFWPLAADIAVVVVVVVALDGYMWKTLLHVVVAALAAGV